MRIARRQRSVKSAEQISLQVGLGCESWAHFTGDLFAQSKECNGPTETVRAINSSEIASLTARHADSQPDNYRFAADVGFSIPVSRSSVARVIEGLAGESLAAESLAAKE